MLVCALLFGGTVLLFSRVLAYGFVNLDDPGYVTANPHVQGGLSWAGVGWAFAAPADYWHPLTWLSHMLDWQLYGPRASGHHLTSIVLHAINAVLAFLVFRRLAGGVGPSALAAAVFAWHPLRVESVVWITERKDVLSGCFFLLTLLAYAWYAEARKTGGRWWPAYLVTLVCFALGLMSKPMLVTLPVVLLILDVWPLGRWSSWASARGLVVEKLPLFALSGIAAVATVLMQRHEGAFVLDFPLGARAGNAVVSVARYLGKFFWPFDLIVCYPHPGYWPVLAVIAAGALVLGLGWIAWRQRRERPWIAVGGLWLLVTLLPVIGLVQVGFQAMADRYTYLPMLGVELALIWTVAPVLRAPWARSAAAGGAVIVLAALALRTWDQEGVWRDSVTLFEHATTASPNNPIGESLLASALYAADRFDEAEVHAERACALNPRSASAFTVFAGIRERQGRIAEAIELYRRSLTLQPDNPPVQLELGSLEFSQGRVDEARRLMTAALRAAPTFCEHTRELGRAAVEHHNATAALFFYRLILSVRPDDAESHVSIGYVLIQTGQATAGLAEWRRALEIDPNYPGLKAQIEAIAPGR